jgi:hypothetical protein
MSFQVDLMIANDNDVIEAFIDNKVLVNIVATVQLIWLGKKVTPFLWMLNKKQF